MHREQKIGLGLGVLLVGVVAAFFFRNEEPPEEPPRLADTKVVDARIAERANMPYLTGVEPLPATADRHTAPRPVDSAERAADARTDDPFDLAPPPAPIATSPVSSPAPDAPRGGDTSDAIGRAASGPAHNDAWSVRPPSVAGESPPPAGHLDGKAHVVQQGDTLTGIAARYLGDSRRYLELYRFNQDILADPHALRIGMKLRIPPRDGRATGVSRPADSPPPPTSRGAGPTAETAPATRSVSTSRSTSPAEDSASAEEGILWPPSDVPATSPEPPPTPADTAPKPRLRFVPVPRSPLNPGPRRLSQIPPDDLPP